MLSLVINDPGPESPSSPRPPTRDDVHEKFEALLAERLTRDEVDRWAAHWVGEEATAIADDVVWWGLCKLAGIDLRHGAGHAYL